MKAFFRKYSSSWFVFGSLAAIAAIIGCNLWYLLNGHCAVHDFLRIPAIGWVLIAANVVAALILYFVKHRNRKNVDGHCCAKCQTDLREAWEYCPNCGGVVEQRLHSSPT